MFKKSISYLLAIMVVIFSLLAILSIWDVIVIKHVFSKSLKTLFVLFLASAIILFIFQVVNKEESPDDDIHGDSSARR